MSEISNLCSVGELQQSLTDKNLYLIDGSWYMPSMQRETHTEFNQQHIPGASFFDIDLICAPNTELPHMLPTPGQFATAVSAMGIDNDSDLMIYDSAGLFSAARVWWMFKVFGHRKVRVLHGGLPAWIASAGQLSSDVMRNIATDYEATLQPNLLASKDQLIENRETASWQVLDARASGRFFGTAPEPRPGLSAGHMPNSISLPFDELIVDGGLKPKQQLQEIFAQRGIGENTPIVTSCGSGVTAAIITLALAEAGFGLQRLYDGAWSEWASSNDTVIIDSDI
ncbi:MAG: thiosulfate/3-mercaptopyruvate sulfurtransferase [Cryomorphaceae bacterium]